MAPPIRSASCARPPRFPDRLQHEHEANTRRRYRPCRPPQAPQPPVAAKKPYQVESPNGSREDEYYWLRDDKRENPEMLAYVKAENAYADAMLAHTKPLETKVYNEIIGRLQQDDSTVPYLMNGYWYFRRFETGKEYPIYSRRAGTKDAPEEILLNGNELAKGHDFFEMGDIAISPNSKLMAWAEDTVGRRQYVVKVMDLATRKVYRSRCPTSRTTSSGPATTRPSSTSRRIRRRCSASACAVTRHRQRQPHRRRRRPAGVGAEGRELLHAARAHQGREISADPHAEHGVDRSAGTPMPTTPKLGFKVFLPRERDHEYQVEHANGRWIVRTNYQAKNFRIVEVARGAEGDRTKWKDLVAHRDDAFVDAFDVARNFLTIEEHSGGLRKLRIRPWKGATDVFVTADEPSYTMALDVNREFDSDKLRYTYQSHGDAEDHVRLRRRRPASAKCSSANRCSAVTTRRTTPRSSPGRRRATARRCR